MTTSVFQLDRFLDIADGVVVGPAWTDDRCRELLRCLRLESVTAPDDLEAPEHPSDVAIAARIFHEVLALQPAARRWPVFSGHSRGFRSSLFKASLLHAHRPDELSALVRLTDVGALTSANVARWMLQLPQQESPTLVFVAPIGAPPVRRSHHEVPVAC